MTEDTLRREIIETARKMNQIGLNTGAAGNISARAGDGLIITPSGLPYDDIEPEDLVSMDMTGEWRCERSERKPSSEWRFHLDILAARPDVGAVLHAHPPAATALATHGRDIPAFHYMVAVAGGRVIRCADYHTFGTPELSAAVLEALGDRNACLMANHGLIACGKGPREALSLAVEVEDLADKYLRALAVGTPDMLDDEEMDKVLEKFRAGYGYASSPGKA